MRGMHCINCMEYAAVSRRATTSWNLPCVHRTTALQDQNVDLAGVAICMAGNGRNVPVKPDAAVVVSHDGESPSR